MPSSQLLKLVEAGNYDEYESRCIQFVQSGEVGPADLAPALERLADLGEADRAKTLAATLNENLDWERDPAGNVVLLRAFLAADPEDATLTQRLLEAYRNAYGDLDGFEQVVAASGLQAGRPFRVACRVLDVGFVFQPGDTLVNRMDASAAEIREVDRENGLVALYQGGRPTTVPLPEVARHYDRVPQDDFRVMRQLYPDKLQQLIDKDPVALVIGLIQSHGQHIDQEMLRDELVPRYLEEKAWSKWWTSTRTKLKRNKHIIIEGRNPVVLSYSKHGLTLEDETREAFDAAKEPIEYLKIIEGYLREKKAQNEEPDAELLGSLRDGLITLAERAEARRPSEALALALVMQRLGEKGLPVEGEPIAHTVLAAASDPVALIKDLSDAALWISACDMLQVAKPEQYAETCAALMGHAPATALDRVAVDALAGGQLSEVQKWIEKALDKPVDYPEILYWLWKGPQPLPDVHLPADHLLFAEIIDTLYALGRTLNPETSNMRTFRQRMRTVLALRDFERVKQVIAVTDVGRAISLRHQLMRLEGIGDTAQNALINALRNQHPELWIKPDVRRLEPWEDPDVIFSTEVGIQRRTAERDDIMNVQMRENAKRIGEAAALGDLSENSEYKFALEERDLLRGRLATVNNELSISQKIEPEAINTERVEIGVRVKLKKTGDGSAIAMTFFGPFDTDVEAGIYNYRAPVSQKLMGKRRGDKVTFALTDADEEYEIVDIENALG